MWIYRPMALYQPPTEWKIISRFMIKTFKESWNKVWILDKILEMLRSEVEAKEYSSIIA